MPEWGGGFILKSSELSIRKEGFRKIMNVYLKNTGYAAASFGPGPPVNLEFVSNK
jgi:hypothetical protein